MCISPILYSLRFFLTTFSNFVVKFIVYIKFKPLKTLKDNLLALNRLDELFDAPIEKFLCR